MCILHTFILIINKELVEQFISFLIQKQVICDIECMHSLITIYSYCIFTINCDNQRLQNMFLDVFLRNDEDRGYINIRDC